MRYEQRIVPVKDLVVIPGFNPRKVFHPEGMEELTASVAKSGVVQSIAVRLHDDGMLQVLAGERRYRAAKGAGLDGIPSLVFAGITDAQALEIANAENHHREDITGAEDAYTAQRAMDACDGDEHAAARLLGWPITRLRGRLALLHATEAVLTAVIERKVPIGVAELLAGLPQENQDPSLEHVISTKMTIPELKKHIDSFAKKLSTAIFDKAECQGCPFNSTQQGDMFSEAVSEGRCTNPPCFNEKTNKALDAIKTEAVKEYPLAFFDREKAPDSYGFLTERGDGAVGPEQIVDCRKACGNYGAIIKTEPGREGIVSCDACFDNGCRAKKAKAYAKSIAPPDEKSTDAGAKAGAAKKATAKKKKKGEKKVSASPRKMNLEIAANIRQLASTEAVKNESVLYALAALGASKLEDRNSWNDAKKMASLIGMDIEALKASIRKCAERYLLKSDTLQDDKDQGSAVLRVAAMTIARADLALAGHFTVSEAFLRSHTKRAMLDLLKEAGFDKWLDGQKGDGSFEKLGAAKVDEIVTAATDKGFDWTGFVPKNVEQRLNELARKDSND